PAVRETVGDVGEHAEVDADIRSPDRPRGPAFAGSVRRQETGDAVTGVGRADSDVMATTGERLRRDRHDAGDTAVRPGVLVVRGHVEETQGVLPSLPRCETAGLE